jgi:hypothetical protein
MAVLKRALSGSEPARGPKLARTFTANSAAAVGAAFPLLSPADWARTRHLLQLAHGRDGGRGGGDTALASEWHAGLLPGVRAGNVAAVAREVRRRSTAQAWEAGLWADAAAETSTYTRTPSRCAARRRMRARAGVMLSHCSSRCVRW